MRYLKAVLLLLMIPSLVSAQTAVLGPAANPPVPISILSQSAIPFIKASSGTMGNNCAISAMTALPRTFSGGAYIYLPAGAIAAGVPASADWYWFVGSSTTAGTCYNQTYANNKSAIGTPLRPPTNTAFATTGPGAWIGDTSPIIAPLIAIPANQLGPTGRLEAQMAYSWTNNANNKGTAILWGASACADVTFTTQVSGYMRCFVQNRGVTNIQYTGSTRHTTTSNSAITAVADTTENTTASVNVGFKTTNAVATDNTVLEGYQILIYKGD